MRLGWTGSVILAAGGLTLAMLFVPVTTSLGQGIAESTLTGWRASYDPSTKVYQFEMITETGHTINNAIQALPSGLFIRTKHGLKYTANNLAVVLQDEYRSNPKQLERDWGTYSNVASPLSPFPGNPVAYSESFLKSLAKNRINPKKFGGPNIPPGSVPYSKLSHRVLQIDTKSDANTLKQCFPGQVPPELSALNPKAG